MIVHSIFNVLYFLCVECAGIQDAEKVTDPIASPDDV
jgi:hypothetical protein